MTDVLNLSQLIITRRKQQGLSRTQVAIALQLAGVDITREGYKDIELERRTVKGSELIILARLLSIDLNALRDAKEVLS